MDHLNIKCNVNLTISYKCNLLFNYCLNNNDYCNCMINNYNYYCIIIPTFMILLGILTLSLFCLAIAIYIILLSDDSPNNNILFKPKLLIPFTLTLFLLITTLILFIHYYS